MTPQADKVGINHKLVFAGYLSLAVLLMTGWAMMLVYSVPRSYQPTTGVMESNPLPTHTRIDINTASAADLTLLPGIGPALAKRIVDDRLALGPYRNMEQLQRVPGIGPKIARRIEPYVTTSP
ncbi:MAG: helix-hairpin-helix domain-containing protein [Phycisphaerales bacterium]|nr:helix-hairpin-helix domain-containing protein [Phycisphaerales bacterium]